MIYSNNETLSFDDVKANLLSKENFDLKVRSDDEAEGLLVRGRTSKKEGINTKIPYQSSGDINPTSSAYSIESHNI